MKMFFGQFGWFSYVGSHSQKKKKLEKLHFEKNAMVIQKTECEKLVPENGLEKLCLRNSKLENAFPKLDI